MNFEPSNEIKLVPTFSEWVIVTALACISVGITFTPIRSIGLYFLGFVILILPVVFGFRGFLIGLALCTSGMFHVHTTLNFLVFAAPDPTLIHLPGFYLTLPECLSIGAVIACLSHHRKLLSVISANGRIHLLVVMLLMAIPFIFIGALRGRALGLYNWANGLRGLLPILILVYPLACLNRAQVAPLARWFTALLVIHGIAWGLIGSVGHGFFLIGFMTAAIMTLALTKRRFWSLLLLIPIALWGKWVTISFTMQLSLAVPVFMGFLLIARSALIRIISSLALYIICLVSIIVAVDVIRDVRVQPDVHIQINNLGVSPGITPHDLQHRINITKALKLKMYDRLMVWMPAVAVLQDAPYQLATGRTLTVLRGGIQELWNAGAHNVFLEWLLNLGVIPGLWMGIFVVGCLVFVIRFGRKFRHDALAVWAALAGLSVLPGLMLGQYPIQSICGFAFWLVIGMCMKIEAENSISKKRSSEFAI